MKLIFHLGYPRTASTFFQTNIFPKHKQINFLGPKNYLNWQNVKISQDDLDKLSHLYLLKHQNDFTNGLIKLFDKKKINVISSERYLTYQNIINNFYDCKFIEKLLQNQNEELKVSFIVVLRNQYDLINSFYHHAYPQIVKFLKIKNFEELINTIGDGIKKILVISL